MKPKVLTITKENATFQVLFSLKTNREKRNKEGFLIEGVRNINNALAHNWHVTAFFYSPEKGISDWAKNILKTSQAETHYELSPSLLEKLSNKEEGSELIALAQIPEDDADKIPKTDNPLIVLFDRPSSPGNLGTVIRSCDALGADGLIITGHAVDIYDPETISATTGSLFALPVVRLSSGEDLKLFIKDIKEKYPALQIVGTDEKGEATIYEHDFRKPTILLAGNEKWGLSAGYKEMVDAMVNIPMEGSASSLNVAVATSIVLSEIRRQRTT